MPFTHADDAAMGNLNYPRAKLDFYPTPPDVTLALLPELHKHYPLGEVWEPACGNGAIADVLIRAHYSVRATDIRDWGYPCEIHDFLKTDKDHHCIVTNPPYEKAEEFCRQAIASTVEHDGVVAMLLRNEFDCASSRVDLFCQVPFAQKLVLTWRPRWIPNSTGAPRHNYAWYIWNWRWKGPPQLTYVLRAR